MLADDTGFQQITVRSRLPCASRQAPPEPPDVADGDAVTIDVQVTVTGENTVTMLAVNIRKN